MLGCCHVYRYASACAAWNRTALLRLGRNWTPSHRPYPPSPAPPAFSPRDCLQPFENLFLAFCFFFFSLNLKDCFLFLRFSPQPQHGAPQGEEVSYLTLCHIQRPLPFIWSRICIAATLAREF